MIKTTKCFWCGKSDFIKVAKRSDDVNVIKCMSCGLMQVAERPDNVEDFYKSDYYKPGQKTDTIGYDEYYSLFSPLFLLWLSALISAITKRTKKYNLLDVGCATGNLLEIIAQNNKNILGEGIDVSEYAIEIAKKKDLNVILTRIEKYVGTKHDLIVSSETLEHLYDLDSFITAISKNLGSSGGFIFYVPSVDNDEIIDRDNIDRRLGTNLEHLIYFTPEFFRDEFPKKFNKATEIHEINTRFGRSIVGIVSNNKEMLYSFKKIWDIIENNDDQKTSLSIKANEDDLHEAAIIISAKFDLSERAKELVKLMPVGKSRFLNAVIDYHLGDVDSAISNITSYYTENPRDIIALKILLDSERTKTKLLQDDAKIRDEIEIRLFSAEAKLSDYNKSRLVGSSIKFQAVLRGIRKRLSNFKWTLRTNLLKAVPGRLREPLGSFIRLDWLVGHNFVSNVPIADGVPLVTIVTPFYNNSTTIMETVDSVLGQTFQNFEYIIVNDGSLPEQVSVLKTIKDKRVHIINHSRNLGNGSPAAARNTGAKAAKGKYLICLDADDIIDSTYVEKSLIVLETDPNFSLSTAHMRLFGAQNSIYIESDYNPVKLLENNMVLTCAVYCAEAWKAIGGYKQNIGYEDWEFWIDLAENGYWGKLIPEILLNYRTAISSRYIGDQERHSDNIKKIKELHPNYLKKIKKIHASRRFIDKKVTPGTEFINLDTLSFYKKKDDKRNVLIAVPWMTFGGAETLIYNYCKEIKDNFNISFVTGLASEHEWEYKFREITTNIYHLPNLFSDKRLYLEFISNYIKTRNIEILHIIHNGFMFEMLPELKKRHPKLRVIVTLFNDRVIYFEQAISARNYIDIFSSDNNFVAKHYEAELGNNYKIRIIPNGIDCYNNFSLDKFDRELEREELLIDAEELAVFFVGRLSKEKMPDAFLGAAEEVLKSKANKNVKFFIIGDGPMKSAVETQIKHLNNENIKYLGYQKEIARYLSAADIFVLPSVIEGFPLSILEAMAMNVVVIASDVGAVSDVIESGKNGFVVAPASIMEITQEISKLNTDRDLLSEIKSNARIKVEEKYSNIILGENYTNLYMENSK